MKDIEITWELLWKLLKKCRVPIGIVITILFVVVIYYSRGSWLVAKAEKAYYENADCKRVVDIVAEIKWQYPDLIASYTVQVTPWAEVCHAFLLADAKRNTRDWQSAVKELTKFLEVSGGTPIAQLAQTSLTDSLLNLAGEQYKVGQYEIASETYKMIQLIDDVIKTKVVNGQTQLYLDWAAHLKKNGNTQQVESILTNLWNIIGINPQQALSVGLTEDDLMKGLSHSSGSYAYNLMSEALSAICKGQPFDSPALAVSGTHRTMILWPFRGEISLPDDLQAITPGDFYYAICDITKKTGISDKCDYEQTSQFGGTSQSHYTFATIIRQQVVWDIVVRDVRTREEITIEIGGSTGCSDTEYFATKDYGKTIYQTGKSPSPEVVHDKIREVIKK